MGRTPERPFTLSIPRLADWTEQPVSGGVGGGLTVSRSDVEAGRFGNPNGTVAVTVLSREQSVEGAWARLESLARAGSGWTQDGFDRVEVCGHRGLRAAATSTAPAGVRDDRLAVAFEMGGAVYPVMVTGRTNAAATEAIRADVATILGGVQVTG
ncbi:hypothetical protein SAMN04244553_1012 [Nocardia amikacinitolerans]|uniref:Lipoprotein LpqN n=1 Tax=Nocardia amikacinitolerans TaxID=756689 RepID=A0A285KXR0_9NOCA|nr:hypothetical protein [Nocardia amikacinitolerans]MCP2294454.1 hypothetical protein [Nocardia amikacinitolerans]SNY77458.1 hypothetical protein SAMN04244553_1012 [Nocardia amikacinitolerans]